MSYFKEFCESIHKTKAGYVPDLLDLVAQGFGDLAMSHFIADKYGDAEYGKRYMAASNEVKNTAYGLWEIDCQDAIDAYNQTIDDAKDLRKMSDEQFFDFMNPYVKTVRYNQAEIDAGFSGTGREFC
jgi:hypothetical protein